MPAGKKNLWNRTKTLGNKPDQHVSMNMWALSHRFLDVLETGFIEFLDNLDEKNAAKKENLLLKIIDWLLAEKRAEVTLLETPDKWFWGTYKEDKLVVILMHAAICRSFLVDMERIGIVEFAFESFTSRESYKKD